MKILYATLENLSCHKGSAVHVKETVLSLHKRGYPMGLIAAATDRSLPMHAICNIDLASRFHWSCSWVKIISRVLSPLFLFLNLLKNVPRHDVVYARDYHTALIAFATCSLFRKKVVWEINGLAAEERRLRQHSLLNILLTRLIQRAEALAARWSHRIVAVTPQIKSYLIHRYGCASEKVEVVSNGVNTTRFHVIRDEALIAQCKETLGIPRGRSVIVFVGNLAPWQGVDYLIQAAPAVVREMKQSMFLIVGEGSLRETFKNQVARLGLEAHFIFPGMIEYEKIPLLINCADVCVLPKRRLASGYSPIKLYEYMACGRAVVSSKVEGLEIVEQEGAGVLVEPEDPDGLGQALIHLLKNPQKRKEMGERGVKVAQERFDWELKVDEIERVLTGLA